MALMRLDKLFSACGIASRREAKAFVKSGRVLVNGLPASSSEMKIDPDVDQIFFDGERINYKEYVYILMYKPNCVITATEDTQQETVIDLLPKAYANMGVFPVGRLDKDTTGLLILTNDGEYAHNVITPKKLIPKCYKASVDGVLDESDIDAFEKGLVLADGTECMSAQLEILKPSVGLCTVYEGKYHQVKRMFATRGKHVTSLHRMSIGSLVLDDSMKPGDYKEMSLEEAQKVIDK